MTESTPDRELSACDAVLHATQTPADCSDTSGLWLRYGDPSDYSYEDYIVGSRQGLIALKAAIDQVLADPEGICSFEQPGIIFSGLKRSDSPDPGSSSPTQQALGKWVGVGCLALLGTTIVLAAIGLLSLVS